jgi:hypothetical protein
MFKTLTLAIALATAAAAAAPAHATWPITSNGKSFQQSLRERVGLECSVVQRHRGARGAQRPRDRDRAAVHDRRGSLTGVVDAQWTGRPASDISAVAPIRGWPLPHCLERQQQSRS